MWRVECVVCSVECGVWTVECGGAINSRRIPIYIRETPSHLPWIFIITTMYNVIWQYIICCKNLDSDAALICVSHVNRKYINNSLPNC